MFSSVFSHEDSGPLNLYSVYTCFVVVVVVVIVVVVFHLKVLVFMQNYLSNIHTSGPQTLISQ